MQLLRKKDEEQKQINWNKQKQLFTVSLGGFSSSKWVLDLLTLSFIFGLPPLYTVSFVELQCMKSIFLPWHGTSRQEPFQQFCPVGIATAGCY